MSLRVMPEVWRPIEKELRAFYRELPRLLESGKSGQYSLLRGEQLIDTWQSYREASRYGHETFDDGRFIIQPVDRKMFQFLSEIFGPNEPVQAGAA